MEEDQYGTLRRTSLAIQQGLRTTDFDGAHFDHELLPASRPRIQGYDIGMEVMVLLTSISCLVIQYHTV